MGKEMISDALKKAREFEKQQQSKIPQGQKAAFHLCSPVGWINDPNGFSVYKGEYHLFHQYHPYGTNWGPMHWGHSKTRDFIRWEQLPAALAPDMGYDGQGCFSGGAVEHEGKHILMYTGVLEQDQEDGTRLLRQTQCVAIGDGEDYEKLERNPVITADMLPKGSSPEDFRDPKLWKEGDTFYSAIGSRSSDGSGQIALFSSADAREWEFVTIIDRCGNQYGKMWECPDFFSLDGRQVLLVSPQDMQADGLEFHGGNGTMYLIGGYDSRNHGFTRESTGAIDYGLDFYAPQTVEAMDGRRIMIGWMQNWDNFISPEEFIWSGMMSVPRELSIRDGRLYQNPVRELMQYRCHETACRDVQTAEGSGLVELEGIRGRMLDLTVDVEARSYERFWMDLAVSEDGRFYTRLMYDARENTVSIDRTHSGLRRDVAGSRSMYVEHEGGKIRFRIIMDKYSVEVFVNDGQKAMTALIYTPQEADGIRFGSWGDVKFHVVKYDIDTEA